MRSDKPILLATQKNAADDDPAPDAIFTAGTLASVLQLLKLPDGTVKVLVEGATRAQVTRFVTGDGFFQAEALAVADEPIEKIEAEALSRSVVSEFESYVKLNKKISPEVVTAVNQIDDYGKRRHHCFISRSSFRTSRRFSRCGPSQNASKSASRLWRANICAAGREAHPNSRQTADGRTQRNTISTSK
jgi:ATP-dependent Lon protease